MARPKHKCKVCGAERKGNERRSLGARLAPVCRECADGPKLRLQILVRILREVTRTNTRGLDGLDPKVRDRWRSEEWGVCPGGNTIKGAAVFLALTGERKAWCLDGVRGSTALVVTRLELGEVCAFRRRLLGRKAKRMSGWRAPTDRLVRVLRSNGPKGLQVEADKVRAHGGGLS